MTELTLVNNLKSKMNEFSSIQDQLLSEEDSLAKAFMALSQKMFSAIDYVLQIEKLNSGNLEDKKTVKESCDAFFMELHTEGYESSWANPAFSVKKLSGKLGSLLSSIYYEVFQLPSYFRTGRYEEFEGYVQFISDLQHKRNELGLKENSENAFASLLEVYKNFKVASLGTAMESEVLRIFGNTSAPLEKVFSGAAPTNESFLYRYGIGIDAVDTDYFNYVVKNEKALDEQANIFVKSFKEGLVRNATKCGTRNTIRIEYTLGQEPFVIETKKKLEKEGYIGYVSGVSRVPENRQASFDHKFDDALYFDEAFLDLQVKAYGEMMEKHKDKLYAYLGIMFVETFGESPFSPSSKPENLKMSSAQTELKQKLANEKMNIREKYLPSEETSFCILGLPTCHAGERLPEIFEATCRINAMANEDYEPVQQLVVDAADKGEYIVVKGCGLNETDMKIALPKLSNPEKQSNFVNCVAEVNVPIGEIFTSPTLSGTNGLLHLPDIYLDGFQYFNLKLHFKDGMVTDFSCTNFENKEENRNFVLENLLYPYETLPIGEFAIGTNTLAYVLAQKLDITRILPVLIVEKMGPHFAIGDTCFSHVEDVPFYNFLDKKEVIARDNEFCQKRKQNPEEGYTNVHTDITIPYDEIGLIAAVLENGDLLKIIENGRFVLKGTDLLNKPFMEV